MRHALDVCLLAAALGLGGYLAATADVPTTNELSTRQDNVLPAFDAQAIERIAIETPQSSVVLRRETLQGDIHGYLIGESGAEVAEPGAVGELVTALEFASWQRRIATDVPLEELGLRPPRLTVALSAGARSYRLLFGEDVPQEDGNVYLAVEGSGAELRFGTVKRELLVLLEQGQQAFRGKALFPLAQSRTQSLSFDFQADEGAVTRLEADALGFVLAGVREGPVRADRKAIDLVFYHLARSQLETFLPAEQVASLQSRAGAVLRVVQRGVEGVAADVILGGQCPERQGWILASRTSPHPIAGCVGAEVGSALRIAAEDFVDHAPFPFQADEIDHVVAVVKDHRLDLLRKDAAYLLIGREHEVPREAGDEYLQVLADARFELLPEEPQDLGKLGTIIARGHLPSTTQSSGNGDQELTVEVFADGERYFLKRWDDSVWLGVPSWFKWAISGDDGWARDRQLTTLEPEQIRAVRIQSAKTPPVSLVRRGTTMEFSNGEPADPGHTRELLSTLGQLQAVRFLSPHEKPATGLLEVQLETDSGKQVLWLGKRTRGGDEAWSTFADGRFVLPGSVRSILTTSFTDRSAAILHPDSIQSLTLRSDDRRYVLRRRGDELVIAEGMALENLSAPIREALLGLHVTEALPRSRTRASAQPSLLTLTGTQLVDGKPHSFEISWGKPTELRGYPMIPAFVSGEENVYFISRSSAEQLLELL